MQLPVNPLDDEPEWACDRCPIALKTEEVNYLMAQMSEEVDNVLYNKNSTVRDTEALIDKLSQFLHKNHYHIFALKHSLIQLYGHQKEYLNVQLSEMALKRKMDMCQELLQILKKLDPYNIRCALYTGTTLYEFGFTLMELGERKIRDAKEPEEKIKHAKLLDQAEEYLKQGRDALEHEVDTPEGKKTLQNFDELEEKLQKILSAVVI